MRGITNVVVSGGGGGGTTTATLYYYTDSSVYEGYFVRATGLLSGTVYTTELNALGNGYAVVNGMEHYSLEFFYLDENDQEVVIYTTELDANMGCFYYILMGYDTNSFQGIQNILNDHKETDYLEVGMTIRTTLSTQENIDFQIGAIDHVGEDAHSIIWVAKNALLNPRAYSSSSTMAYFYGWQENKTILRTFLNNEFYNSLQSDVKPYVKDRITKTAQTGRVDTVVSSTDKVFIPRQAEVLGNRGNGRQGEITNGGASQFAIFSVAQNRIKTKGVGGTTNVQWYNCSPSSTTYSTDNYCPWITTINTSGNGTYCGSIVPHNSSLYVVPCFLQSADS